MSSALALTVLLHPDRTRIGERAFLGGLRTTVTAHAPLFRPTAHDRARPLSAGAPDLAAISLWLDHDGGALVVRSAGSGPTALAVDPAALERGHLLAVTPDVLLLLHRMDPSDERRCSQQGLVGSSAALERVRRAVLRVGALELPVLLRGETGSGKELVAHALHAASPRRAAPSVALNVGALSPSLAPSELFGHLRGAFTGATEERPGYLRQADHGTLFLDEIGEAPLEVQAMLLRALETQRVQPVGSPVEHPVDLRVVAATDLDLTTAVREGRFRAALYYRLAGYELVVPPLRERREDVASLLFHFWSTFDGGAPPALAASTLVRLLDHDWPGNVRQLRNVAHHLALADHPARHPELLDLLLAPPRPSAAAPPAREPTRRPREVTPEAVLEAMTRSQWRIERAAELLGVHRTSMYRLIAAHPLLRTAKDVSREELLRAYREADGELARMSALLRVSLPALRGRLRQELGDRTGALHLVG